MNHKIVIIIILEIFMKTHPITMIEDSATLLEKQLSDCILNISSTYFRKDTYVMIQTPGTWFPYFTTNHTDGNILLSTLHEGLDVPVLAFGSREVTYTSYLVTEKPGSYVILLNGMNKGIEREMAFYTIRNIPDIFINKRGRLIIAAMKTESKVNELFDLAYDYVNLVWEFTGIADIVLLIPTQIDNSGFVFNIFTWYPEEQGKYTCTGFVSVVKPIDVWIGHKKAFLLNANLFPSKEISGLHKCNLIVAKAHVPGIAYINENGSIFDGLIPLALMRIANVAKFKLFLSNGDKTDLEVNAVYNTFNWKECTHTYPHFRDHLTWFVPAGTPVSRWKSLGKAFSPPVWILVLATFITGWVSFWVLPKIYCIYSSKSLSNSPIRSLLNVISCHLGIGISFNVNGGAVLFFTIWLYYCLVINTAYQSALIGFLVNPGEIPPIKSTEDLHNSELRLKRAFEFDTRNIRYYDSEFETLLRYELCERLDCFEEVSKMKDTAVLGMRILGSLITLDKYTTHLGKATIVPIEENVRTFYFSVSVQKLGCLIYKRLDTMLHRFVSSGLYAKTQKAWQESNVVVYERKLFIPRVVKFNMSHTQGGFYILLIGELLGIVVFVTEIFVMLLYMTNILLFKGLKHLQNLE